METASSMRVHTSVTRISSVGKLGRGAQIPPDLGGVLDHLVAHQHVDRALVLAVALEALRQAGARQLVEDGEPVALEAGVLALPERARRSTASAGAAGNSAPGSSDRCAARRRRWRRARACRRWRAAARCRQSRPPAPGSAPSASARGSSGRRTGGSRRRSAQWRIFAATSAMVRRRPASSCRAALKSLQDAGADLDLRAEELGRHLLAERLLALLHQLGRRAPQTRGSPGRRGGIPPRCRR